MLKTLLVVGAAFGVICIGWAINPGLGIFVAILAYGAVDGLLNKD